MKRVHLCLLAALSVFLFNGCQVVTNLVPTGTPYPTQTPYPTLTPYPTYTPLPSATETPTPPAKKVLFQEDKFSSIDSCFPVDSDSKIRRFVEDGQYHIVVQEPVYYGWTLCDNDLRNFTLEVDATVIEGPANNSFAYGVVFRQDSESGGFYAFMISGDGYYSVNALFPEFDPIPLLSWASLREINHGKRSNHLKATAIGDQMEVYVNNTLVGLIREGTFRSGPFGFIVETFEEGGVQIAFDNLVVTEP